MAANSSDQRVALVRRTWELYNEGELDAALELFDPEVEVYSSPELANPGAFRGVEELVRWITTWDEAWESFHVDDIETVPVGQYHVVIRMRQTGIGRGSGVEVAMEVGWLYEIRDGRCVHLGLHPSFEAALAVAREREGMKPPP